MLQSLLLPLLLLSPQASIQADSNTLVVKPELREVMHIAPLEHHRAYIVMTEQPDAVALREQFAHLPRGERQLALSAELRSFSETSQATLREAASLLTSQGHISWSEPLWIANSFRVEANAAAIETLAAIPGISYIQYDPVRDPMEMQDIPLKVAIQQRASAGTSSGSGRATTYYFEDFESGSLGAEWATTTTGCGREQITSSFGPYAGSKHWVCDSSSDGCYGTVTLTLTVDLSAQSTVQLQYAFKDLNDEFNTGSDILQASDDGGTTWKKIADLTGSNNAYVLMNHDLDTFGLNYVSNFMIRWSWYDNYSADTDGFAFDNIELADYFPPPPPPSPEPNLVKHQAPDLWGIGIDGSGAVLLNIDSGTDRNHPDLANRIWTNPNDPVDGVDNDGNGYVDDYWGWNFSGNNNNPSGGGHGTSTAGIMVGDGSGGVRQTGMAPGASLAVCQLGSEADHWGALQWGLSVAVDCSSSSYSYKWPFSPRPDYHQHRAVSEIVLAGGQIHCNSIGNQGGSSSYPIPFNISAPGNVPGPWIHPQQANGGIAAVLGCSGISVGDDTYYDPSGRGPSAWEDIKIYDSSYPHSQNQSYWDYPVGGWGLPQAGLLKPDIAGYTDGCYTTSDGGGHSTFGGTSCATPHIGGATALMVSANARAEPRHISEALQIAALDKGSVGKDLNWGSGVAKVYDAAMRLIHLAIPAQRTAPIGSNVTVNISGPANATYGLFYSLSLGTTTLPNIGDLDLANGKLAQVSNLSATGESTFIGVVPNNPLLVGKTVYVQSVCNDLAGATGQALFSLVEKVEIQ